MASEGRSLSSQPELLDALGHPWEQEAAYMDRVYRERHTLGTHKKPHEGCPLCMTTPARGSS